MHEKSPWQINDISPPFRKGCQFAQEKLNDQPHVLEGRRMMGRVGEKNLDWHRAEHCQAGKCHGAHHYRGREGHSGKPQSPWRMGFCADRHALTGHCPGMRAHVHAWITLATRHVCHGHAWHSSAGNAERHGHCGIAHPCSEEEHGQQGEQGKVAADSLHIGVR